ncbi:hybrid sensor histidine kinase/response regulator [Vibrio rotiferianus]|uniref:histidine kinase n=2 Tax=Vibrio rotiferianus TaxID=190895 RepID=A0A510IAM5_9VIBR|nr:hybrid sensor histidine kinase/response regulator [Vibrio rotiferianus]
MDWTHVPIFLFIYLFGNLFYFRNQVEHEAKVSIAKSFGAGIAHEMRNPLSGLCSSIDVMQSIIPDPKQEKKDTYQLSIEDIELLREISDDAMKMIQSGNETIDLLLTSIDENRVSRATFKKHNVQQVIENAIESFSYKRASDRAAISIDIRSSFGFLGSDTLLKYVVYNLFKNAFHHRSSEDFHIHVTVESNNNANRIVVTDNGAGISVDALENIFRDFYTTGKSGNYGLGLPFCKKVMRSFGGDIKCVSELGEWSQFTLTFPLLNSPVVEEIKDELIKLKSVLLISNQKILVSKATDLSRHMGFQFDVINTLDVFNKKEYEFEYDVIFVDLESIDIRGTQLDRIESLLSFTEGQIVYLFQQHSPSRPIKAGYFPIWMETQAWLLNTYTTIERLLFDVDYESAAAPIREIEHDNRRTIMVVDDNESLRKFTALLLEKQGFDVIQREDGEQALEALSSESIDLILMDIEMPVMDGIETSRKIRSSKCAYSTIPIIAHTGDSSPVTLEKIESSGMSDFIVKPADKARLFDKIAHWI